MTYHGRKRLCVSMTSWAPASWPWCSAPLVLWLSPVKQFCSAVVWGLLTRALFEDSGECFSTSSSLSWRLLMRFMRYRTSRRQCRCQHMTRHTQCDVILGRSRVSVLSAVYDVSYILFVNLGCCSALCRRAVRVSGETHHLLAAHSILLRRATNNVIFICALMIDECFPTAV